MESKSITAEKLYSLAEISEALKLPPRSVFSKFRYWEADKEANKEANKEEVSIIYESKINIQ